MKSKTIRQTVTVSASPHDVYEMLMDSEKHSLFTGEPATISRKVGGSFSTYSGYGQGKNLALVPDKKIVQTWRGSDWEEESWSEISIVLTKSRTGTRLTFVQTGVHAEQYDNIKQGWIDFYWNPMKAALKKK